MQNREPVHALDLRAVELHSSARPRAEGDARIDRTEARVAVLIPCYNEAITIGQVVSDFRCALPEAEIFVYDNVSTDATAAEARAAGARVRAVPIRGKGEVLRRMFADVEADVYVVADGDGTYDATAAPLLIDHMRADNLDMVVGRRVEATGARAAYRTGHRFGNHFLSGFVSWLFGTRPGDMLSGFRVLSRRYVKSFPATATGFEVETEMTIHALDLRLPFAEVETTYRERPPDSHSKLRTIPDALHIMHFTLSLLREYRPIRFFGFLAIVCSCLAAVAGADRGLLPSSVAKPGVGIALVVLAALFMITGFIVESLTRARREMKRMLYLAVSSGERYQ